MEILDRRGNSIGVGRGRNFQFADLSCRDLRVFPNLNGAAFDHADLAKADLHDTCLAYATFNHATLNRANLTHCDLVGANFAGADVAFVEFAGADLSDAVLAEAINLTHAHFRGAKIDKHILRHFIGVQHRKIPGFYDYVAWTTERKKILIRGGCRTFTLEQFRRHVATEYPNTPKAEATTIILDAFERMAQFVDKRFAPKPKRKPKKKPATKRRRK